MNFASDPQIIEELADNHLRYVSNLTSGFSRQGTKNHIKYYDLQGKRITDKKILDRIQSLTIPPAWKDVWICPQGNGHIQATGIDEKGRKQYIYHLEWIKICQENKFSKLIDFGLSLPKIRSKVHHDMKIKTMDKRRLLATIVWLLEHTFIRIGNEEYSRDNDSFGLTTLREKHIDIRGGEVVFEFKGKSGVHQLVQVSNPTIVKTIKHCVELPGYELFHYVDENGDKHVVDSSDVNSFLQDITKDDFSAKDFRTWGATNLSAETFYKLGPFDDQQILKKNIVETVKKVAKHLNNTVSVCRNYYIHPTVFTSYEKKTLVPLFAKYDKSRSAKPGLNWEETALINLLQKNSS